MADYVSVLTGGTNNFSTTSEHLNALATDILTDGVVGTISNTSGTAPMVGALAANAQGTPNMTVAITAGKVYVTGTPTGQASQRLRLNIAAQNATIASNATGGTRYDYIYAKVDPTNAANPSAAGDNVASIYVSRSTSSSIDNGTPPTYGYCIAMVTVVNGAGSITNGNIADKRSTVVIVTSNTSGGWNALASTPNTIVYNGNRNYDLTFNGVDLTSTLSQGMKLKLTRTVAAPTQCTSLNGTTQYYSKSSPAGMTFTNNFVVSAWVKATSYGSADNVIASHYNGTSGWEFKMGNTGLINLVGYNAASSNNSYVASYQSIPLNKWVHITAQLDMSTFTATTTTSYIMIDGVDVPASITRNGTNPTALIQAGNLEIGSRNGGLMPFPGKIAQVAIFSAKIPQATIQGYISQGLTGTETSLISAYSLSGATGATDLNTTNANNLTANGSATTTNADAPYANAVSAGNQEYAEINSVTFSTNTVINVRVPDTSVLPTSGGVSAVAYSTQSNPYGLPYFSKVLYKAITASQFSTSSGVDTQIPGFTANVYIPTSSMVKITFHCSGYANSISGGTIYSGIWDGAVTSGTILGQQSAVAAANSTGESVDVTWIGWLTAGNHTINGSISGTNTAFIGVFATAYKHNYLSVELV